MVIALLLCGLLGPFGAHRFYVGRIFTGTLQLLAMLGTVAWVVVDFPYHDGELSQGLLLAQLTLLLLVNAWPSVDFYRLISGKFTDATGLTIAE